MIIAILVAIYIGVLTSHLLKPLYTDYVLPRNLWILVPFRWDGWRSPIDGIIYKCDWMWSDMDFSETKEG